MSRALLVLALALSLGNPAAVRSWAGALVQLALPTAGEVGSPGDPNGGTVSGDPNGADSESDYGGQWDPNGAASESDYGSKWDPNG
jgi:hypothetical protein